MSTKKEGFTIPEILVTVAILAVIIAVATSAFSIFIKKKELDNTVNEILSVLDEAQSFALAAKGNVAYGVHFENTDITLFSGGVYSVFDPSNEVTTFPARITATTTFTENSQNIIFERLTGKTNIVGTINVSVKSDSAASTTITINEAGVAER